MSRLLFARPVSDIIRAEISPWPPPENSERACVVFPDNPNRVVDLQFSQSCPDHLLVHFYGPNFYRSLDLIFSTNLHPIPSTIEGSWREEVVITLERGGILDKG